MAENNKGENIPDKKEKQKLEKDILELLSSASEQATTETEIQPERKVEKEIEVPGDEAAGPGKDMSKRFLELFPESIPPASNILETSSRAPEKTKILPEAPSATPQEASVVKSRQSPAGITPGGAAPAIPKKEEKIASPEIAVEKTEEVEIALDEMAAPKPESFLSKLFRPIRKTTVCLSLEGSYIRILSLRGREIVRWSTLALNPRYIRNGVIINPLLWGEQLLAALEKEQIKVGNLYCAFSAVSVIREFKFPRSSGSKLSEIVDREARRVLSFSSETSILRWQQLDSKGQSVRVFVMLVPRDPVMRLVEALGYAGLKPSFIELKPMALIRTANAADAIIAHGELNSLELSIVVSGEPRVFRSIYLGDVLLRKEDATARLIDELARTLAFYNETYRDEPLDISVPLFLTGELAIGSPLSTQIKALTGRVVAPLNIKLNYPPSFPLPAYLVNIGLALKALS